MEKVAAPAQLHLPPEHAWSRIASNSSTQTLVQKFFLDYWLGFIPTGQLHVPKAQLKKGTAGKRKKKYEDVQRLKKRFGKQKDLSQHVGDEQAPKRRGPDDLMAEAYWKNI